jgi:CRISPR system Cascade subunit CasB
MESNQEHGFVRHLRELAERQERGSLAALRKGLGQEPGTVAAMYSVVVPHLPEGSASDDWRYYLIGALFAWHPSGTGSGNLGEHFGRLKGLSDSIERRFVALLAAHRDDLPDHLRQAIGLLKSKEVPVNWDRLFRDLRHWDHADRFVQRAWARSFYRPPTHHAAGDPSAPPEGGQTG